MKKKLSLLLGIILLISCNSKIASDEEEDTPPPQVTEGVADIVSVSVSGEQRSYQFAVGIRSPDIDCSQYANWWEIVSEEGNLIYRRILAHSHPSEQPFIRSGGPVDIGANDIIIIRAHMHTQGYGGIVYEGSVSTGFEETRKPADFAATLNEAEPLPSVCTG